MLERVFGWRDVAIDQSQFAPRPAAIRPKPQGGLALALGGGAARGWAHIGVLKALDEYHVPISMIARSACSIPRCPSMGISPHRKLLAEGPNGTGPISRKNASPNGNRLTG